MPVALYGPGPHRGRPAPDLVLVDMTATIHGTPSGLDPAAATVITACEGSGETGAIRSVGRRK
jgi:hypothetical protein